MRQIPQKELDQHIEMYWWNGGQKTVDFKGRIEDCLKDRKIEFKPYKDALTAVEFSFYLGNNKMTYAGNDFTESAWIVLKMFVAYLGDQTQIKFAGRNQKFNWRC